jgi:predicted nucleotidyltransferase
MELAARRVAETAPAFPALIAAYLFGSALGLCRRDSDVDLGVIVQPWGDAAVADRLEVALGSLEGHPFHVTSLKAESMFAHKVIRGGRLVFSADEKARTDFVLRVALQSFYDGPHRRTAERALREEAGF